MVSIKLNKLTIANFIISLLYFKETFSISRFFSNLNTLRLFEIKIIKRDIPRIISK